MPMQLRVVIAQINYTVGDINGNTDKIIQAINRAKTALHANVVLFPELTITGYPPEDLLFRPAFIEHARQALIKIAEQTSDINVIVGHPHQDKGQLYNAASLLQQGAIIATYYKQCLPNYGVFDEQRYFTSGSQPCIIELEGIKAGLLICEDIWLAQPAQQAAAAGAELILCMNASPFSFNKHETRLTLLQQRTHETPLPIIYAASVGGQDEIMFDGGSMAVNAAGQLCAHAGFFQETLLPIDVSKDTTLSLSAPAMPALDTPLARIYQALVLGIRDYSTKNHFSGVLIGLSGGIDSALTLALAVDALGNDKVHAVIMPSRYTADISIQLAEEQAKLLKVNYSLISIENSFQSFLDTLTPEFADKEPDITEENLQSRCRGVILMALSNKTGKLVLTTSNKSEMAVGYATLYGDMAGGFAALKDVWKTTVFELAHYRNGLSRAIPEAVISRPPTAELKADQKDEDTLPAYPVLDAILQLYVEQNASIEDICAAGFAEETVKKIIRLVKLSEYKRRQSPPGVKITNCAFGRERRYPITSGFKDFS